MANVISFVYQLHLSPSQKVECSHLSLMGAYLCALCAIPCYAHCTFTWCAPDAVEMTCCVQPATGGRYSALLSPVLLQRPEGHPGPTGLPGLSPASLPAGTPALAYCTSGRL